MIDQSSLVHTEDVIIILKFGRKFMLENVGINENGQSLQATRSMADCVLFKTDKWKDIITKESPKRDETKGIKKAN